MTLSTAAKKSSPLTGEMPIHGSFPHTYGFRQQSCVRVVVSAFGKQPCRLRQNFLAARKALGIIHSASLARLFASVLASVFMRLYVLIEGLTDQSVRHCNYAGFNHLSQFLLAVSVTLRASALQNRAPELRNTIFASGLWATGDHF